jgi:hypothetical protein
MAVLVVATASAWVEISLREVQVVAHLVHVEAMERWVWAGLQ